MRTDAAAPLHRPRIAAAPQAPVLRGPAASLDAAPSLPALPRDAVAGPPIGTVPAALGTANILAKEAVAPPAGGLEQSTAGASGEIEWSEAKALIQAGEVGDFADLGDGQLMVTLCSGRGVLTELPSDSALLEVDLPKIVCGIDTSQ